MRNLKLPALLMTAMLLSAGPLTASYAASQPDATPPSFGAQPSVAVDDAMITSKVKAAINADQEVSSLKIKVKTKQGTVVLTGTVPSAGLSDHVLQLVASIEGVRDVKNDLKIKGTS